MIKLWNVPFSIRDNIVPIGGWPTLDSFLSECVKVSGKELTRYNNVKLPKVGPTLTVSDAEYDQNYNLLTSGNNAYWISGTTIGNGKDPKGNKIKVIALSLVYDPRLSYAIKNPVIRGNWSFLSSLYKNANGLVGCFDVPAYQGASQRLYSKQLADMDLVQYKVLVFNGRTCPDFVRASDSKHFRTKCPFLCIIGWSPDYSDAGWLQAVSKITGFLGVFTTYIKGDLEKDNVIAGSMRNDTSADEPNVSINNVWMVNSLNEDEGLQVPNLTTYGDFSPEDQIGVLSDGSLYTRQLLPIGDYFDKTTYYPYHYLVLTHPYLEKGLILDMRNMPASGGTLSDIKLQFIDIINTSESFSIGYQKTTAQSYEPLFQTSFQTDSYASSAYDQYVAQNPYAAGWGRINNYVQQGLGMIAGIAGGGLNYANTLAINGRNANQQAQSLGYASAAELRHDPDVAEYAGNSAAVANSVLNAGLATATGGWSWAISAAANVANYGLSIAYNEGIISDLNKQTGSMASNIEKNYNMVSSYTKDKCRLYDVKATGLIKNRYDYTTKRFGWPININCRIGDNIETEPAGVTVDTTPTDGYCYAQGNPVRFTDAAIDGDDYLALQGAFASGVELYYYKADKNGKVTTTFRPYDN